MKGKDNKIHISSIISVINNRLLSYIKFLIKLKESNKVLIMQKHKISLNLE